METFQPGCAVGPLGKRCRMRGSRGNGWFVVSAETDKKGSAAKDASSP